MDARIVLYVKDNPAFNQS